jgi:hypothetical protein
LALGNRCEHQQDSAVGKIEAGDDILDPDRSGSGKQNFVLIGDIGRRALLPQPE